MEEIAAVSALFRQARRPVIFTGAGMSAESGVPTFRNAQSGLWSEYDPARLATPSAFSADKALVWGWYVWRMALVRQAQPHAGHLALSRMQRRWLDLSIVTQNVDDLHERAGSGNIVHLHGELFAHRCFACARPCLDFDIPLDAAEQPALRREPPRCQHCGGKVRPGVVWFGEPLPEAAWQQAKQCIEEADVMLVVGTSGVVQPAASLVGHAKRAGARIIEINLETSTHSRQVDVHLLSSAAVALDQLATELERIT